MQLPWMVAKVFTFPLLKVLQSISYISTGWQGNFHWWNLICELHPGYCMSASRSSWYAQALISALIMNCMLDYLKVYTQDLSIHGTVSIHCPWSCQPGDFVSVLRPAIMHFVLFRLNSKHHCNCNEGTTLLERWGSVYSKKKKRDKRGASKETGEKKQKEWKKRIMMLSDLVITRSHCTCRLHRLSPKKIICWVIGTNNRAQPLQCLDRTTAHQSAHQFTVECHYIVNNQHKDHVVTISWVQSWSKQPNHLHNQRN